MIITLTSDFGKKDHYVAKVKGILLQHVALEHIIEISHDVSPYSLLDAAYLLKSAYIHFPKNTVHVSLMHIMTDATPARAYMLSSNGQYIITANNALLSIMFKDQSVHVAKLPVEAQDYFDWIEQVAQFLGKWQHHHEWLQTFESIVLTEEIKTVDSLVNENTIDAHVLHIDQYHNLIFDLTKEQFESASNNRSFEIELRTEKINKISNDYKDVPSGNLLARFNHDGYLEIAVRDNKASQLLGLNRYEEGKLFYTKIKIVFT